MSLKLKERKEHFRYLLCHPNHPNFGLSVYMVNNEYLLLRPSDCDLELFLEEFVQLIRNDNTDDQNSRLRLDLTNNFMEELFSTVDSEWDKKIIRVLIGSTRSRVEIEKLGLKSDGIARETEYVQEVIKERLNTKYAAEDMVKLRLNSKLEKTKSSVETKEQILGLKKLGWTKPQLYDLEEEIEDLKD